MIGIFPLISSTLRADRRGLLACSAIKEYYRQQLMNNLSHVLVVYLKGTYELIWLWMSPRKDHYMKPQMLQSQFETLEEPANRLTVEVSMSVCDIVQDIYIRLVLYLWRSRRDSKKRRVIT